MAGRNVKKRIIAGLLLGAVFAYLSLKDIDFNAVAQSFSSLRYGYILPVVMVLCFMQFLRSYRWGVILRPVATVDQVSLFSVTSVGFLAIIAIPARLGELARPYLIARRRNLAMTAALGSIFLERVFDVLTILLMFFAVAFVTPMPSWMTKSAVVVFVIGIVLVSVMVVSLTHKDASLRFLLPMIRRLPERYSQKVESLMDHFIGGFAMIADIRLILYVAFLSLGIWGIGTLAIYLLFGAFDFHLSPIAAFAVMVIFIIGITIPTAPGFVGNWHFFCILGLTMFGIPKADAVAYAVIYHVIAIGVAVALGLAFLPFNLPFLTDLKKNKQQ
jgi:uncharacterized protein (TIRG00374 family)